MGSNRKIAGITDLSQRKAVKMLRFLYPIWLVVGPFSLMYVPSTLIVAGDAATTASNIIANELLFRMGIAGSLVTQLLQIFVVLALYKLFKAVNNNLSILMVIFAFIGIPISMFNSFNRIAAVMLLSGADYLSAFTTNQLQTLSMFFLSLNDQVILTIPAIFWGLWLLPMGLLIKRSGYFPKILGNLMLVGGVGYLLGSFAHILLPSYKTLLTIFEFMTYGEVVFIGWVIFKGAKLPGKA